MTNAVLSDGLTNLDFSHSIVQRPKNLLLLDPNCEEGEYEPHTGLKIIREPEEIERYFLYISKKREPQIKWIDFNELALVKQLTPMEISELLYFGHMRTQLHSPFFYKLQNNYVFFETDRLTKVYYRHLEEFYLTIGGKITRVVLEKLNNKKSFFKRAIPVEPIPLEIVRELHAVFQEGIVLSFKQEEIVNKTYTIPIYVVEDRLREAREQRYTEEMKIASLVYNTSKKTWHFFEDELN